MIDLLQILQVTIYSKVLNELSTKLFINNYNLVYFVFIYFIYQIFSSEMVQNKMKHVFNKFNNSNSTSLTITGHRKVYQTGFGGSKQIVHILYSEKFRAITHYLLHHKLTDISNFKEMAKIQFNTYQEESTEFVMIPEYNQKILLCSIHNIFIEICIYEENTTDEKEKLKNSYKIHSYKLSINAKNKYHILDEFVTNCLHVYNNDIMDKKTHMIFEYAGTHKDEYDKIKLQYHEYPFKSNKLLDKNIYFEGKDKLIEYVDKFKVNKTDEKSDYEREYEEAGVTFKASILLRGPPGCGKSCTIRGILNRTGRHGVLVTWSKLKTCNDFCSLFRTTKINDKEYSISDLCFIFEDFDANKSDILKNRMNKSCGPCHEYNKIQQMIEKYDKNDNAEKIIKELDTMTLFDKKMEDELTLECVLNVLDGIIELHNTMIIFTTNHLEHIDPAFTRSGRIDFHHEFKLASIHIIKEMLHKIRNIDCENPEYNEYFANMTDYLISPADIQNICFKYTNNDVTEILTEIVTACKNKNKINI